MSKIIFLLCIIFANTWLFAQTKIHKHITTTDGLVNNNVRSIYEDSKGYVWFATMGGISKWDGQNFKNYTKSNGLEYFQVFDIFEGTDSTLYFATFGRSIITIKNDVLDTINIDDGFETNFVMKIQNDYEGNILFSGADGTVSKLSSNKFSKLNAGIPISTIYDILYLNNDHYFIASHDYGFIEKKSDSTIYYNIKNGLKHNTVWQLEKMPNDLIIIATEKGVNTFTNNKISHKTYFGNEINVAVRSMLISKDTTIYYGSTQGLYWENKNGFGIIDKKNGLTKDNIICLTELKNGQICISSADGGVDFLSPNKLETLTSKPYANNSIKSIYKSNDNVLYVGTNNGLFIESNNRKSYTKHIFRNNIVNGIAETDDGKIWVALEDSGLRVIDYDKIKKITKSNGLLNDHVSQIRTYYNDAYAFTFRGMSKIHEDSIVTLNMKDGIVSNYLSDIFISNDSTIYYSTHGKGVSIKKNGKFQLLNTKNGLTSDAINLIFQRSDGAILIGTDQAGLNILQFGFIDTITTQDGLLSNQINAIAEDSFNNVYVATSNGINILKFTDRDFTVRTLTEYDGLSANECNSLFIDDENNILIGTTNGLSKYNPRFDKVNSSPPPTYITGLEIFNKPISFNEFVLNPELNYDENYLKIHFIGINISAPHKTVYQFKLNGVDRDWVTSNNTNVQYTSLDDGNYVFEVKAKNEWGYWSEPAKLAFVINPAWWETWWFYTLSVLALGSMIAFFASYRYRHLLAIEKVRTKISADLHDNIGSGLTEISFLSEMVKSQVKENEYANKGLNNIAGISKTLIDDMRDIVWLVNPNKDSLKDLFLRLQDSYQETLNFSNITLLIHGLEDLSNIRLPISYRQNIYLMFKEAINNSIKYSDCTKVEITVKTDSKNLYVELIDNGKGFDINTIKLGNGINNIKNRAEMINGTVEINSEINVGTKIKFVGKFSRLKISEV